MTRWNAEVTRSGGRTNAPPKPSETQFRIAAFIGWVNTEGIAGTDNNCDVAGQSESSNLSEPIPPSVGQPSAMAIVESEFLNNSPASLWKFSNTTPVLNQHRANLNDVSPTGAQSSNPCKRKRSAFRQQYNDDLIEIEQQIGSKVRGILKNCKKLMKVCIN